MTLALAVVLAGFAVVMAVHVAADRSGLPAPVLLVIAGLAYGFLPGPNLQLDPEVILTLVIPPLLYAAALNSSLGAIRSNARTIVGLSVGLVLVTAVGVGVALHAVIPSLPLAACIALGAAVAPPDPVAALAVGRRAGLPPRLVTLVEGEGLLNDATALTTLNVAVAATASGLFSLGDAAGEFAVEAIGGLVVGLLVALSVARVRRALNDTLVENALSLCTPFAAYLLAEAVHVSGVLAVVVAALWLGHHAPLLQSGPSRLQTRAVWRLVEFLLEGYVFLLIGQQLPAVVGGLGGYSVAAVASAVAVTVAVVLGVRPLWLVVISRLPARLHLRLGASSRRENTSLSGRDIVAMSWAGTRGVITLAAAFSLPLDFPGRNLLLVCAYSVVPVTLLLQGLTFAPLLRVLRLGGPGLGDAVVRNQARVAAVEAALVRLDEMLLEEPELAEPAQRLRANAESQLERFNERLRVLSFAEEDRLPLTDGYRRALRLRRAMIDAEREVLLAWRDRGQLPDASLRILERELDHQESVLPEPGAGPQ